ncbi:MAG: lysoplasmalogenase [Acidobacteriia bacterium]|nr:lysoplasmalogenase [Terriglobia bacterium]
MWNDWLTLGRWPGMDSVGRVLLRISLGSSLIFFLSLAWQPYPGSVVIKAMCILTLALLAFRLLHSRDGTILGLSLLFSSLGDVFLALNPGELFIFGLGAFLIAHFLYIVLFVQSWPRPAPVRRVRLVLVFFVFLYGVFMADWLLPGLGTLKAPVMAYLCVITLMVMAALRADFSRPWVVIGAALFILSDSLIAVSKFKHALAYRDYLVWISYYVAQYFIGVGFLREKLGPRNS